jgi:arsenate reductase (glutaredoxin)
VAEPGGEQPQQHDSNHIRTFTPHINYSTTNTMSQIPKIRIFHHPGCRTSRNVLGLIQNANIVPEIIDYLHQPLSQSQLQEMRKKMNVKAQTLLRDKDPIYTEINPTNKLLSDQEVFDIIEKNPSLLPRPIVDNGTKIKLCRPAMTVLELLPTPQTKHYVFENGDVLKSDGILFSRQSVGGAVYKNIIIEQIDTIRIISIHRPDRRNAIDESTAVELLDAFEKINNDQTITAAILTGTNGTFCAGYDLKSLSENLLVYNSSSSSSSSSSNSSRTNSYDTSSDFNRSGFMGPSRLPMRVPVIAAVEGHAVAGGLELSLWCDIRIVSSSAIFGVHCRRWGVPLIDGGTVRLPRLIGQSRSV